MTKFKNHTLFTSQESQSRMEKDTIAPCYMKAFVQYFCFVFYVISVLNNFFTRAPLSPCTVHIVLCRLYFIVSAHIWFGYRNTTQQFLAPAIL